MPTPIDIEHFEGSLSGWAILTNLPSANYPLVAGRTGNGRKVILSGVAGPHWSIQKTYPKAGAYAVGIAVHLDALPPVGFNTRLARWSIAEYGLIQDELRLHADGSLSVWFGGGTFLGACSPGLMTKVWNKIDWHVSFSYNNNGGTKLRVNGDVVLNLPGGLRTSAISDPLDPYYDKADTLRLGCIQGVFGDGPAGGPYIFDDFYLAEDFVDDTAVRVRKPVAAGAYTQWVPNPSGPNYENVNEDDPNGDTDRVEADTVGQQDLYEIEDLPSTDLIKFVLWTINAKSSAQDTYLQGLMRLAGIDYQIGTFGPLPASYGQLTIPLPLDPAGNPWTVPNCNVIQSGMKF